MRPVALAGALCVCSWSPALAQGEERWLVVASDLEEQVEASEEAVEGLIEELADRGIRVWGLAETTAKVEAKSAPSVHTTQAELAHWRDQSRRVLETLILGQPGRALKILEEIDALNARVARSLNETEQSRTEWIDTCLLGVRAELEAGADGAARARTSKCRRISPNGIPSPILHPPDVRALLEETDAHRTSNGATLQIDSSPSDCAVKLNGTPVGRTPTKVERLVPGDYEVEVECAIAPSARIHLVSLRSKTSTLFVDAHFDSVLRTRPFVHLAYPNRDALQESSRDLQRLRSLVPAERLVRLSTVAPNVLEVSEVDTQTGLPIAFVLMATTSSGPTRGDIALGSRALVSSECIDLTSLPPKSLPCIDDEIDLVDPEHPQRRPPAQFAAGLTLASVGGSAWIAGLVLSIPRARAGEDWVRALDANEGGADAQERWNNLSVGLIATSASGSAALVAAMPLVLPNEGRTPWWAWLSGGTGVALTAVSIAMGVTAEDAPPDSCRTLIVDANDARACVRRGERISAAVITATAAAPLLTIPLVYLLRRTESSVAPSINVTRARAMIAVSGQF